MTEANSFEKALVTKKEVCVLPSGVSYKKISLPSGKKAYVFHDEQLGELGRLVVLSV